MPASRIWILFIGLLLGSPAGAGPLAVEDVPEPLQPWVPWVLHGHEQRSCPFLSDQARQRECVWPGRLELRLTGNGGRFSQGWQLLHQGWTRLPGNAKHWPQDVSVNGEPVVVTQHEGGPAVLLGPGTYRIEGAFQWERLPEFLQLPSQTGIADLTIGDTAVRFPDLDKSGRLWLGERERSDAGQTVANTLELEVYRRIVDTVPLQVSTRLELKVAGEHREVVLGPVLMAGYIPLVLSGPLPARVEADGRLRLQVRPGRWSIVLTARHPGPVDAIQVPAPQAPWPDEEVWVFDARNHLRLVTVGGLPPVDPRQTALPEAWRSLPAYRARPGEVLQLLEKRRGDPEPEPDRLNLQRSLWLDFDGAGYTVQDNISGTLTRGWRLEADASLALGRVAVDGEPQFITRLPGSEREGVEVRRGQIRLLADSRLAAPPGRLAAVGWDHDIQSLGAVLNLPPGWRLLAASGADRVQDTWITRWTLLELFLVLIIAAAVGKLWAWPWGGLALLVLALTYHEPGAPTQVWLHILAAVALARVLPPGRIRQLVLLYRHLSLIALAIIALPFLVDQVRTALYPPVERPWQTLGTGAAPAAAVSQLDEQPESPAESLPRLAAPAVGPARLKADRPAKESLAYRRDAGRSLAQAPLPRIDPDAQIQTGPGLPSWQWNSVRLSWNGPVERDQELRLLLVPPAVTGILRIIAVLALVLLALRLAGLRYQRDGGVRWNVTGAGALALAAMLLPGIPESARADMPSQALLDELRERLLEEPECLPVCAQSPRMHLEVEPGLLRARMEVHALAELAVPLPGHRDQWLPSTVLLDGEPAEGLMRDDKGRLWLRVVQGAHQVSLEGLLPLRDAVQLALPLRPRQVTASVEGWTLDGVHENGLADGQLQLTRVRSGTDAGELPALESGTLPPFVTVERTLRLGLEWQVETRVVRVSPAGSAVVTEVPLLDGESVTTAGARVENGRVLLNMAPGQRQYHWLSVLERRSTLTLTAPEVTGWTEVWRLDVSPIWHARLEGIPVVHHQSETRWLPEWRPWPGESVTLAISRPQGVEGRTLTVQQSTLTVKPGLRATDAQLGVTLRSSQGGQHKLTLPEGATLQSVSIHGRPQAIRQEGRAVTIPVTPGQQRVELSWRQSQGMTSHLRTPPLDLGTDSVNATLLVEVPPSRWVLLTGGPPVGPAVLIWGVLAVILLVAVALGRTRQTPLRTHHWLLLGLGLSQVPVWSAIVAVGWFFALGARQRAPEDLNKYWFNLMQIGLAVLTLVVFGILFQAVEQGLLGRPEMQIAGNGSSANLLRWYQDRADAVLTQAWIISVPTFVYRLLMLAWALWLAFALIRWLRWGWGCYATAGLWRSLALELPKRRKPRAAERREQGAGSGEQGKNGDSEKREA